MVETVKVAGLAELQAALLRLNDDVQRKVGRAATYAAARIVQKAAIEKAPISKGPHYLGGSRSEIVKPGNLRRNIRIRRVRPQDTQLASEYTVDVRRGSGRADKDAFYWHFVEFGTVKAAAKPFLRPAFDENVSQAIEAMRDRLKARIDKANSA